MDHLMGLEAKGINNIFAHYLNSRGNVGLFFHVDLHVLLKAGLHGEALTTVDADVRIQVFMDLKVLVKIGYAAKYLPTLIALQAMSFMYDYSIFRLYCQLPTMVRFYFHHMLALGLKQHLSKQSLASCRLDFCSCETVHLPMFHLDVVVVRLCNDCVDTGHCSQVSPQTLDL